MQQSIKVMKLTSGDTIVAKLTKFEDRKPFVQIDDPVQFTMMYKGNGEGTLVAQQWLETNETSFSVHKMQIVAEAEPNDMLKDYYYSSLEDINSEYEIEEDLYVDWDNIQIH